MVVWTRSLLLAAALCAAEDPHLARLRLAALLPNEGRLAEAVPIYEDGLRQVPQHPDALHLSGLAALAAGKEPLEAFGSTAALICAHVAIFVFHGAPDDYNKLPLAWLALFGGLAVKALN